MNEFGSSVGELGTTALKPRSRLPASLSYGRGREAAERCEGREISRSVKTPPKGPIVFSPFRHLAFGQPTKLRVDRLGDRDRRDHHQHDEANPGPRKNCRGAAAAQGKKRRAGARGHTEDGHHRIRPKQRPPEIDGVLFKGHSPP